ncbi:hypothetical protein BGW42_006983 [Actinomortierella wolfii]|nr:hypothetical protein BGW42_006983 [Actinomortierella wolfii]
MSVIEPPASSGYKKKPDAEAKAAALKEVEKQMEAIRPKLAAVKDAIAKSTQKSESDPRTALRKRLAELRDKQAENKRGKQAKIDQLNQLNASLKKKIAELRSLQDSLPYKTNEALDAQVAKLEKQLESGSMKLVEEKRTLNEISVLKKAKKSVEAAQAQQAAIDADKAAIAALKETIDDSTAKALSAEYNKIQAELDEITKAKDAQWKQRNSLFDERNRLQKELDALYQQKRTINDEYMNAMREWQKFQQEIQARKKKEYELRKQQENEEKRLAIAKEERELAEIPAFTNEINTINGIFKYLVQFSTDEKYAAEAAEAKSAAAAPQANIRQPDTTSNVPEGVMLTKKSEKDEEVYFVGGKGKKSKAPKEKKVEAVSFKLPLLTLEQLLDLKIPAPSSSADVNKTLDALLEKKAYYLANQEKATAENKRKAEERIAKLSIADVDSTNAEAPAEIEATAFIWNFDVNTNYPATAYG